MRSKLIFRGVTVQLFMCIITKHELLVYDEQSEGSTKCQHVMYLIVKHEVEFMMSNGKGP